MNKYNLSTVERDFVLKTISERKRLDGREAFHCRDLNINFGVERGCCIVDLGRTKVPTYCMKLKWRKVPPLKTQKC